MTSETAPPAILPWRLPTPDTHAFSPAYRAALGRIYGYSEAPRSAGQAHLARTRKLDRMRTLLNLLGAPQSHFATVLVAGTKGKGSTAALLTSILHVAGYRVGRYTQPHLYSYRERTWAAGQYISETELVEEVAAMQPALDLVERAAQELGPLTTFDVGTAQTLLHFARAGVKIAVVEVGIGGAHDVTNVLEPIMGLIGPVGLDHVEILGPTLCDIAREKAGITRRGIDVVVAPQYSEAMASLRAVIEEGQAVLHTLDRDAVDDDGAGCAGAFTVMSPLGAIRELNLPLLGRCQRENAALAVTAACLLERRGWAIGEDAMRAGAARVDWPGRFQTVVEQPTTVVDGAHNPFAAHALAETVRECFPGRRTTVVLGMSTEKDAVSFLAELAPIADRVIVTRARHPRSSDPARLAAVALSLGLKARVASSPGEAVACAWAEQPPQGVTLVTGSLFLVGDVMEWLLEGSGGGGRGLEDCQA